LIFLVKKASISAGFSGRHVKQMNSKKAGFGGSRGGIEILARCLTWALEKSQDSRAKMTTATLPGKVTTETKMTSNGHVSIDPDFYWVKLCSNCVDADFVLQADQEEPHRTRRQLIQKAHPEVY
jgi:hypothetical protein